MSYSSLKRSGMARVNEGSHSCTCHLHVYPQVEGAIPAFTPQPHSITALWTVLISRSAKGRRLRWPRWLVTYRGGKTVTHPSANRARRRVTLLIRPTPYTPYRHHVLMLTILMSTSQTYCLD